MTKTVYFEIVIACANLDTAEIVKAEIKHEFGYEIDIRRCEE